VVFVFFLLLWVVGSEFLFSWGREKVKDFPLEKFRQVVPRNNAEKIAILKPVFSSYFRQVSLKKHEINLHFENLNLKCFMRF
jgi:hypothetical protein